MNLNLRATTHRWADRKLGPDSGRTLTHANDAITVGATRMHAEPDTIVSHRDRRTGRRFVDRHGEVLGLRVAFDVGDGLAGDLPQLTFLHQGKPTRNAYLVVGVDAGPLLYTGEEVADDRGQVVGVGDLGAQIEQRVAHVGDDGGDLGAEVFEDRDDLPAVGSD